MQISVPPPPFPWAEDLHYSQAVVAGDLVFSSGQGGFGENGELVEGGFEEQLRQAFANLDASLRGAGASLDAVVKLTVFLADPGDYNAWRRIRSEVLTPPWPAATAVSSALLVRGMVVELEAVAVRGTTRA
jgi:2-iminobutanoate/2-iminopropanoate deaminase